MEGARGETPDSDELAGVTKLVACGHIFCRAWYVKSRSFNIYWQLVVLIGLPQFGGMD